MLPMDPLQRRVYWDEVVRNCSMELILGAMNSVRGSTHIKERVRATTGRRIPTISGPLTNRQSGITALNPASFHGNQPWSPGTHGRLQSVKSLARRSCIWDHSRTGHQLHRLEVLTEGPITVVSSRIRLSKIVGT